MDIRTKTALIVERSGEYLVAFSIFLRWSNSKYDAWQTRNVNTARMVANKVNGRLMLFNPITRQIKEFKGV